MSWLFPLTKSASSSAAGSPGGLTSLQQQKQRLIESLRNSHSSLFPVSLAAQASPLIFPFAHLIAASAELLKYNCEE
ncbi:VPS37A isoform 11 [Pan troglodytes]|uniref:VPS37A subunit of ESCRT-I n=5 Tax=Homininae TaxID=207598 RepID=E5RHB8_HUMAN|nr:VPS37A subunit of ESCRT-I [Homo sapiens]KAI4009645.1 VPS37A subunit of ESCRT-I [Homo sapiens]PNI34847.1 VPS37A isoform 11 [Pan troglodytes]